MKNVVITGVSARSSIGSSLDEMVECICKGKTGLAESDRFLSLGLGGYPVGLIADDPYSIDFEKDPIQERTHHLMSRAILEATDDAALEDTDLKEYADYTGLSIASSTLKAQKMQEHVKREVENRASIPLLLVGDAFLHSMATLLGLRGEVYNTSTACSSGTAAIGIGYDLIADGSMKRMIVASADSLVDLSMAGFHSLQVLTRGICRPFDHNFNGINLGEAAVAIILEEEKTAQARGVPIYAQVLGYGLANDAYSLTSPDPDGRGASQVMRKAMEQKNLCTNEIGYVNTHGTGTHYNDAMEQNAMAECQLCCDVSSTKSFTGHCLGTAGLVEAAICIAMARQGLVPPTYGVSDLHDDKLNFICNSPKSLNSPYILSNSFAFGGNCASVLLAVKCKS